MHPPFTFPNHPVGPTRTSPMPEKRVVRRSKPEALRLIPAAPSVPPVPLVVPTDNYPAPAENAVQPKDRLQVVPIPRNTLRDRVGRFLIRIRQRMILDNHPG